MASSDTGQGSTAIRRPTLQGWCESPKRVVLCLCLIQPSNYSSPSYIRVPQKKPASEEGWKVSRLCITAAGEFWGPGSPTSYGAKGLQQPAFSSEVQALTGKKGGRKQQSFLPTAFPLHAHIPQSLFSSLTQTGSPILLGTYNGRTPRSLSLSAAAVSQKVHCFCARRCHRGKWPEALFVLQQFLDKTKHFDPPLPGCLVAPPLSIVPGVHSITTSAWR